MDLVLIDAPCTGIGTWRRNPDAKWRVRPGSLEQRQKDQAAILDRAVALLKPGGRIVYITCSVLDEENGDQIAGFVARHPDFVVVPPAEVIAPLGDRGFLFRRAVLMTERRAADDAAAYRHRRVLRQRDCARFELNFPRFPVFGCGRRFTILLYGHSQVRP